MSYLGSTILENILEFGEKETARENYLKKTKNNWHTFFRTESSYVIAVHRDAIPLITNHFFHSLRSHILMFFKVLL